MYKSYMVYSIAKYIEHRILARNRPVLTKITETCDRVSFGATLFSRWGGFYVKIFFWRQGLLI